MTARRAGVWGVGIGLLLAAVRLGAAGTLSEVRSSGTLHVCANPEALPFTSQDPAAPGVQLELAQAVVRALGTKLRVSWVYGPRAVRLAGCDVLMGAVASGESRGPLRLTRPYFGTGYVMLRPRGTDGAKSFEDLRGRKIGVQVQSVAQWVLTKRGLTTTPALTDEEVIEKVLAGEAAAGAIPAGLAAWYLKQNPGAPLEVAEVYVSDPELRWNVAVGLRNADQALADAVTQILQDLSRDGSIESAFSRYGVRYHEAFSGD
jgi:polar amino acid transport system substrate-binding protein